ncbi:Gcd10p family protein [Sodiomyces alkalinus F11]|uniref:tRNA (adenine(58)-N(1))-methyltransferase non-catalytic subunit TRM6 n=1 Tax=Sodiomyces alkalinus (strain CBS 110278 / VKM F-3762 / F11) TaxID=1314773 RepID=A0A3N2PL79_SODAK|nr:Gcd10p family protein [Sodiomyces alkalinus F11]ROT35086.1 Gcd10p family protein [Sodiomyces alkalinus F11]
MQVMGVGEAGSATVLPIGYPPPVNSASTSYFSARPQHSSTRQYLVFVSAETRPALACCTCCTGTMHTVVQHNEWVAIKLPTESVRIVQVVPNILPEQQELDTISLGKYGSFPSNLIIDRPYHFTYEVLDKRDGETFNRLRVVPASEIHADVLAEEDGAHSSSSSIIPQDDDPDIEAVGGETEDSGSAADNIIAVRDGADYTLVDRTSGDVLARSGRDAIDAQARQLLTHEEIEALKKQQDTDAGKAIITRLMLSHTGLADKTSFSLAKYKILKTRKYLRRFSVAPLYPSTLGQWILEEKEASKVLEMRQEMLALLGCWANVHFAGRREEEQTRLVPRDGRPAVGDVAALGGRWLVVDDTGGLVVAAMAERMGILHHTPAEQGSEAGHGTVPTTTTTTTTTTAPQRPSRTYRDDFEIDLASSNSITLIHPASQPNLALLRYWNFDIASPHAGAQAQSHPLFRHLHPVSWLQLLDPASDTTYTTLPADVPEETVLSWKSNRRGNHHRKRRRWARTRFVVDQARAGGFAGLVVATTMDPISVVRHALPLLAGGSPVAVYSATIEPLTQLADCFSIARRAAWSSNPPAETEGMTPEEVERWPGSEDFPVNPTLLLGCSVQTSRAKRWQVLPGRTHPLMMGRGGADGFLFTAWRAVPAEGKVAARGKFKRRKTEV